jgi:hypothetical protein
MNTNDPRFELIRRCRDGESSADELAQLESYLCEDADFREAYVRYINLDVALGAVAKTVPMPVTSITPSHARRTGWLNWRPLTAAAAGLIIGLFSASVVFAFVTQRGAMEQRWPLTLANGGFESLDLTPQPDFVPVREDVWSGDFTSLSEGEQGVSPCEGRRMLKFLRADNRDSPPEAPRGASEVWQVVKVAKLRTALGRDLQTLELSARFNQADAVADEPTAFGVSVLAFAGAPEEAPAVWRNRHEMALAEGGKKESADGDALSWQRVAAQITVPKEATHLLLYLRATRKSPGPHSMEFGRHFADDVRLTAIESTSAVARR